VHVCVTACLCVMRNKEGLGGVCWVLAAAPTCGVCSNSWMSSPHVCSAQVSSTSLLMFSPVKVRLLCTIMI